MRLSLAALSLAGLFAFTGCTTAVGEGEPELVGSPEPDRKGEDDREPKRDAHSASRRAPPSVPVAR